MNGPRHYREAEDLIAKSNTVSIDDGHAALVAAQAQVHATLALAAATVDTHDPGELEQAGDWAQVLS